MDKKIYTPFRKGDQSATMGIVNCKGIGELRKALDKICDEYEDGHENSEIQAKIEIIFIDPEKLTPSQAAELIFVHINTIYNWYCKTRKGELDMPYIPNEKFKGGIPFKFAAEPPFYIPKEKFEKWVEKKAFPNDNSKNETQKEVCK
jgi:hypothetical protein